ncbi:MAG: F0F1 ATP synthase subunit gamma [Chromatocurvus sp.]
MSETKASLVRKIRSAGDLHSVVRTMKAISASQVTQFENSVRALGDYHSSVELALSAYFQELRNNSAGAALYPERSRTGTDTGTAIAVVFGSDQGLVGQFNKVVADYTAKRLGTFTGQLQIWAVGERVHENLSENDLQVTGLFSIPTSVQAIVPLVGQLQIRTGLQQADHEGTSLFIFHNRPQAGGGYEPVSRRLLPLDVQWKQYFADVCWPGLTLPQVIPADTEMLRALIGEHLFISIFRACAESLASENASRLAAMTRAERNIEERSESLVGLFHRLRQNSIDEELFDVVSGYDAIAGETATHRPRPACQSAPSAAASSAVE